VSNLEAEPAELLCDERSNHERPNHQRLVDEPRTGHRVEILAPRDVPLGGPRAMSVHRTLPQRARSLIGAWCFLDHYGPNYYGADALTNGGRMIVPPHPHTGLQTVSWLFAGEIEHRDSTGAHAMVRPGELNLMTAGAGIQHSEVSTPATTVLHGAQLWVALPASARHVAPFFEHVVPEAIEMGGCTARVFLGSLAGTTSSATTFTPLVGAQIDIPAGSAVTLPVDAAFEHGVLSDAGTLSVENQGVPHGHLAYLAPGPASLTLTAGDEPVRALLIGGTPLGESIVMWWNFIGRSHEEIVEFRRRWQRDVIGDADRAGPFGHIHGYDGPPLLAPDMPTVRLKPRD